MGEPEKPGQKALVVQPAERYIHSDIFDRLLSPGDPLLVGLVAYGLYQTRKRQWIQDFRKDRGRVPDEQEVKNYSFGHRDDVLVALKSEAEGILFRFAEEVMEEQKPQLQATAFNLTTQAEIGSLKGLIKDRTGYRHHIFGHIAGFVVLAGIVAIVAVVIAYEPSLKEFFGWANEFIKRRL